MANRIVDIPKKKPPRTTASKKKSSAIKSAGKGSPFRQSLTKKKAERQETPAIPPTPRKRKNPDVPPTPKPRRREPGDSGGGRTLGIDYVTRAARTSMSKTGVYKKGGRAKVPPPI